jgi:hypothetical protein
MGRKLKREAPLLIPLKIQKFIFKKISNICNKQNISDLHQIEIIHASFLRDLKDYIESSTAKCPIKKAVKKLSYRINDHLIWMQTSDNETNQYV